MSGRLATTLLVLALASAACAGTDDTGSAVVASDPSGAVAALQIPSTSPGDSIDRGAGVSEEAPVDGLAPRPDWLGTRVLPTGPDGRTRILPTPAELIDRRLATPPLPDPAPPAPERDDLTFTAEVLAVPEEILARSTWTPDCPVPAEDLRYLIVRFFGFDGRSHAGELLAHADVADDLVRVFATLHAARFPLEEVRIISQEDLSAAPTGDGNVTSVFVCRRTVGGSRWSEHAFGRAIDINPFHNPYVREDRIIPELAGAYVERDDVRPGMIVAGDVVTEVFRELGWGWGGDWTGSAVDPMHFSPSGR